MIKSRQTHKSVKIILASLIIYLYVDLQYYLNVLQLSNEFIKIISYYKLVQDNIFPMLDLTFKKKKGMNTHMQKRLLS